MKRYIIFSYVDYYPNGGKNDEETRFDSMEECIDFIKREFKSDYDNYDILDLQTGEWIENELINPKY